MFEIKNVEVKEVDFLAEKAGEVWREIYYPLVGEGMTDYMIEKVQSAHAIKDQIENQGYEYYWPMLDGERAGFFAMYPRDDMMYISKFYLFKDFRGKRLSFKMMDFVKSEARARGLKGVFLNVNKKNERAIKAYGRLGLTRLRDEEEDVGQGYRTNDYIMGVYF